MIGDKTPVNIFYDLRNAIIIAFLGGNCTIVSIGPWYY
jgi:hypothetical protein